MANGTRARWGPLRWKDFSAIWPSTVRSHPQPRTRRSTPCCFCIARCSTRSGASYWLLAIGYWLFRAPGSRLLTPDSYLLCVCSFHVSRVTRHPSPVTRPRHSTLSATLKIPSISKVFKAFQRKSFYPQTRRRARFSNLSTQSTHLTLTAVTNLTM